MILLDNVNVACLQPIMMMGMVVIESVFRDHGVAEVVFTHICDGAHMKGSLHPLGLAVDVRIWGVTDLPDMVSDLAKALGNEYDVVLETDHIHVEYDPE